MRRADVIVVGCGVMGAATARAVAMAGRDVLVLERFTIGHTHGSSHGTARIYRHSYTDPSYVRMMSDALPLWRELEEEVGERLLQETGAVNIGASLEPLAQAIHGGGGAPQWLKPEEVLERYGIITHMPAVFDPTAGVVRADAAWRALARSAQAHGAVLEEHAHVIAVRAGGDHVELETTAGEFEARVAVVTAGAFARALLEPAGIALGVRETCETVTYFSLTAPAPVTIDWTEPLVYALPCPDGTLKVGRHITGPDAEPEIEGSPAEETVGLIAAWVAQHMPRADPTPLRAETCLYTMTADENFILQRRGRIVVGSPCSGHGFKFAPLIGARLAALASG